MSTKFHKLSIKEVRQETIDTVSISLSVPLDLQESYRFKAGQYLTFKTIVKGQEVRRSYSICSAPSENELRVAVKRIDKGAFSTFATSELREGTEIDVMPPLGNFVVNIESNAIKNHVFFAAGSGITPILSMVKHILASEKASTVYLFYVNKSKSDTIFKTQIDAMASGNSNLKLVYLYTQEDSGNAITNGRVDEAKCEALFSAYLNSIKISDVYSCGPEQMIMAIKDFFISKGLDKSQIHFELFTASASAAKTPTLNHANVNAEMTVIMDDEKFKFNLSTSGKTILQASQDAGADVPFSCKGGVCCTCKAKVMEGTVKMDLNYSLEPEEVEAGYILTCQSHPTSERVTVSFDEY